METDGEDKFVSLFQSCSSRYIALQNESGSRRSRLPGVSLLWSTGAAEGLNDLETNLRGDVPKKRGFFVL